MYFENSDQCELTVRYHLTQVQAEAWGKVVETLHALTAVDGYGFYETKARDFEDMLIEVLAETVYELTEEERPPVEPTGWDYGCNSYYASEEACWEHGDEDVA